MNKIKCFATRLAIVLTLLCNVGLAKSYAVSEEESLYSNRIDNITSQVDLRYSSEVLQSIRMYTKQYRKGSEALLGRASIYFPVIENHLRDKQLPDELKYLAVIESSLRVNAKSNVGAVGMWQFMKGTARMYNLKVNNTVDERRDPFLATDAALEYLGDLYQQFGDWTVALAAYNCGPGNVRKAIRRSGGKKTYWEIRPYLPRETRRYIPKFIAAAYLMNYYHDHELLPETPEDVIKYTATAKVYQKLNLKSLSQSMDLDMSLVKQLNPAYLHNYIPSRQEGNILTLPEDKMFSFLLERDKLDQLLFTNATQFYNKESSFSDYRVLKPIEDLPSLRFDEYATMRSSSRINLPLILSPFGKIDDDALLYEWHTLGRRESILDIAKSREDIKLLEIFQLNDISLSNPPAPGSKIKIKRL